MSEPGRIIREEFPSVRRPRGQKSIDDIRAQLQRIVRSSVQYAGQNGRNPLVDLEAYNNLATARAYVRQANDIAGRYVSRIARAQGVSASRNLDVPSTDYSILGVDENLRLPRNTYAGRPKSRRTKAANAEREKSLRQIDDQYSRIDNKLYQDYISYKIDEDTFRRRRRRIQDAYDRYVRNIEQGASISRRGRLTRKEYDRGIPRSTYAK